MRSSDLPAPTEVRRISPAEIQITWSNGQLFRYRAAALREACPCASCREKRRADQAEEESRAFVLPVLSAAEARPTTIEQLRPVGNYAYNISFGDGHRTGLFTLEFLYQLGAEQRSP